MVKCKVLCQLTENSLNTSASHFITAPIKGLLISNGERWWRLRRVTLTALRDGKETGGGADSGGDPVLGHPV